MSKYQFALFGDCKKDSDVEWGKKKAMGNSQNRVDFILVYWSKSDDQDYTMITMIIIMLITMLIMMITLL